MWAWARTVLPLLEGLAFLLPFLAPALLGASCGYRSLKAEERRKLGIIGAVSLVAWSALGGAALVPLAAHYLGIPDAAGSSLAVFISLVGAKGTDALLIVRRAKKILSDEERPENGGGAQ